MLGHSTEKSNSDHGLAENAPQDFSPNGTIQIIHSASGTVRNPPEWQACEMTFTSTEFLVFTPMISQAHVKA